MKLWLRKNIFTPPRNIANSLNGYFLSYCINQIELSFFLMIYVICEKLFGYKYCFDCSFINYLLACVLCRFWVVNLFIWSIRVVLTSGWIVFCGGKAYKNEITKLLLWKVENILIMSKFKVPITFYSHIIMFIYNPNFFKL